MNRREFIKDVLRGKESERLPRALFGAGLWAYRQAGLESGDLLKDPVRFGELLSAFLKDIDTDIVFGGSGLNSLPADAIGGQLDFRPGQAPLLSSPIINKIEDARYFDNIDLAGSPYCVALVEMLAVLRKRLPDRFFCATSWGPFTWGMILCDWTLLREKVANDRIFIREVCELGVRLSCALFRLLKERDIIDGISIPEGAVTLIPLDVYSEVVLPSERMLFETMKNEGLATFLHQCGDISRQFELYPETKADCISIDAGIPIGKAYELYRDRLITAGNVDVVNTISGGDSDKICKAVSDCVSQVPFPYRKYILMPSCDLPPKTPLSNVKEFLSCADQRE